MTDTKGKKPLEPRRALGRGLDALLGSSTSAATALVESEYQKLPIESVYPQPGQPRRHFDPVALEELAESLRAQGLIQPIVVRRNGDRYELVAGERRWRAAQRAGMREIPAVVKDVAPAAAFELALVENLQRTDLDAIETAMAYQRLLDEHGYTQELLADRVGKSRASVANTLRLLTLPPVVREQVVTGALSEGHARALLSLREPEAIERVGREAVERGWSVRQTEAVARKPAKSANANGGKKTRPARSSNPNVRDLEKQLAAKLGLNVVIRHEGDGQTNVVEIYYDDLDQLDRVVERILG